MDEIAVLRMFERILAVLIGGGSVYLGYRLFFHIPHDKDHSGSLELPGVKLVLTKVGPGVFFAGFGCVVVFYSLTTPVEIEQERRVEADAAAGDGQGGVTETSRFAGMGPTGGEGVSVPTSTASTPQQRNAMLQAVEMINCLHQLGKPHDGLYELAMPAVNQAKRALFLSAWDSADWGDPGVLDIDGQTLPDESPLQFFYHAMYGACPQ